MGRWGTRRRYLISRGSSPTAAESFAELDEALWNPISTAAVSRSHPRFDERVLDACCGDGASALPTAELVGVGGLVDAVDLVRTAHRARARARRRADAAAAAARRRRRPRGSPPGYDLVQCVLGVHFFPDVEAGTPAPDRAGTAGRPGRRHRVGARGGGSAARAARRRAARRRRGGPRELARPTIEVADTAGSLAHWLTDLGLVERARRRGAAAPRSDARARVAPRARHRPAARWSPTLDDDGARRRARALPRGDRRARASRPST